MFPECRCTDFHQFDKKQKISLREKLPVFCSEQKSKIKTRSTSLYPRTKYSFNIHSMSTPSSLLNVSVHQPLLTFDNPFSLSYLQQLAPRSLH